MAMHEDQNIYYNITLCHDYVSDACSGQGRPIWIYDWKFLLKYYLIKLVYNTLHVLIVFRSECDRLTWFLRLR